MVKRPSGLVDIFKTLKRILQVIYHIVEYVCIYIYSFYSTKEVQSEDMEMNSVPSLSYNLCSMSIV